MSLLEIARRYFDAIEARAPEDVVTGFFDPRIEQREFPNQLVPAGATRDLTALVEASRRGRAVMVAETYTIRSAVEQEDRLALEVTWTGTLAVPFGKIAAGGVMTAHFGVFLRFRDGLIIEQHNYDCFEPWG